MDDSPKYSFDHEFQVRILALCVQDAGFFIGTASHLVKPSYFDAPALRAIFGVLSRYQAKYQALPTLDALRAELVLLYERQKVSDSDYEQAQETVPLLYESTLDDAAYVRDAVVEFGRQQGFRQAILEAVKIYEAQEGFDRVPLLFEQALATGDTQDLGYSLGDAERLSALLGMRHDRSRMVRTMLTGLDNALLGGMSRGEVHLVVGRPGVGKSTLMVILGANALYQGKKVLYVTLEISQEMVLAKLVSRVTGLSFGELVSGADLSEAEMRLGKLLRVSGKTHFWAKFWPNKQITTAHLRSYLARLRMLHDFRPDLIIIDYADLLLPTERKRDASLYEEGGNIMYDLVELAESQHCPVLTASQPQRHAYFMPLVELEHLADSARKAHVAHSIITINQTRQEEAENKMRLYTAKVRTGITGKTIYTHYDKARCQLREVDDGWTV